MTTSARIIARHGCSHLGADRPIPGRRNRPVSNDPDEPRVYHLRHVILRGIARCATSGALPNCQWRQLLWAYLFRLEDDEAIIPVAVLGICGRPVIRDPEVEDGDRVEVSATIQAPSHGGHYLSFKGWKAATEQDVVRQSPIAFFQSSSNRLSSRAMVPIRINSTSSIPTKE